MSNEACFAGRNQLLRRKAFAMAPGSARTGSGFTMYAPERPVRQQGEEDRPSKLAFKAFSGNAKKLGTE